MLPVVLTTFGVGNPKKFDPTKMPMIMGNHFVKPGGAPTSVLAKAAGDWDAQATSGNWYANKNDIHSLSRMSSPTWFHV